MFECPIQQDMYRHAYTNMTHPHARQPWHTHTYARIADPQSHKHTLQPPISQYIRCIQHQPHRYSPTVRTPARHARRAHTHRNTHTHKDTYTHTHSHIYTHAHTTHKHRERRAEHGSIDTQGHRRWVSKYGVYSISRTGTHRRFKHPHDAHKHTRKHTQRQRPTDTPLHIDLCTHYAHIQTTTRRAHNHKHTVQPPISQYVRCIQHKPHRYSPTVQTPARHAR